MRETEWSCVYCGYAMDTATSLEDETAVPEEGSVSICMNCFSLYIRSSGKWRPMTESEQAELPEDVKQTLQQYVTYLSMTVSQDLSKKQQN